MRSLDALVRDWTPQPLARASLKAFSNWKRSLTEHLNVIAPTRSAHHPIDLRLQNMLTFIEHECAAHARVDGPNVVIEAGKFFWLLARLERRQESMKRLIDADDPFVDQIDPALRQRIRKGWRLLYNADRNFWPRVHRLQRQIRTQRISGPALRLSR